MTSLGISETQFITANICSIFHLSGYGRFGETLHFVKGEYMLLKGM